MVEFDASIVIKLLFPEPHSDRAAALMTLASQTRTPIVAPPLLSFEVTNVIRRRMVRNGLSLMDALTLLSRFERMPLIVVSRPVHRRALEIADQFGLSAAYDAHYVALAELLGCNFWTDDQRLLNTVRGKLPFVRWIGDFQGAL